MLHCQRKWLSLLALCSVPATAQADLVLTNFNSSRPMKIMAVGDSITDDCVFNGAWRRYLQPLLESNGYSFTFVGRQVSSALPSFTKVHHEGYCGAVIAPPGVSAAHQYSTTDNYLQKIVPDALAITNNIPDLMLVLIGANDIGRGRDPFLVATNDMVKLLNLIFSNAPNVNVILAKPTSLQGAASGYGAYATNVPIYNAALQALVNQRRAAGQNVHLADMFSTVNNKVSMFQPDLLHPNAFGLSIMAGEWLARIQTITIRTNLVSSVLVHGGDFWKYFDQGLDLGTNWTQPNVDDRAWSSGLARLGYGDETIASSVSYGPDPTNKYITTYFRHSFVVPWDDLITNLDLRLAQADGAVVWLNGRELYRVNMPAGPISFTNLASRSLTLFLPQTFYQTNLAPGGLTSGTNILAVEIHKAAAGNSTLGFDMELIGTGRLLPAPTLAVASSNSYFQISWPQTNGGQFTLYSTTNLSAANSWMPVSTPAQTNSGQIVVTQPPGSGARFFRLQSP